MSILPVACITTHPLPSSLFLVLALLKTDHLLRSLTKPSWPLGIVEMLRLSPNTGTTSELGLRRGFRCFQALLLPCSSFINAITPHRIRNSPQETTTMLSAEEDMVGQKVLLESLVHVQGGAEGDGKLEQPELEATF